MTACVFSCVFLFHYITRANYIERTFPKRPRAPAIFVYRISVTFLLYLLTFNYLNEQKFKQQEINIEHEKIARQLFVPKLTEEVFHFHIIIIIFHKCFPTKHSCSVFLKTQNSWKFGIVNWLYSVHFFRLANDTCIVLNVHLPWKPFVVKKY